MNFRHFLSLRVDRTRTFYLPGRMVTQMHWRTVWSLPLSVHVPIGSPVLDVAVVPHLGTEFRAPGRDSDRYDYRDRDGAVNGVYRDWFHVPWIRHRVNYWTRILMVRSPYRIGLIQRFFYNRQSRFLRRHNLSYTCWWNVSV